MPSYPAFGGALLLLAGGVIGELYGPSLGLRIPRSSIRASGCAAQRRGHRSFGIVPLRPGEGLWRFFDDPPEKVGRSV